ncbi:MAG: bifunctional diguanylate cyclase/phosphodiesterase [Treponema sp.]|jgi:diguanylate cyclase (GGDEF)-like protein|nr:bifunctional diguanylate cyclase/phosphodiesterase [Treponema sp.]
MLNYTDFNTILNSVPNPVLVLSPVYNEEAVITDFIIEYVNKPYLETVRGHIAAGDRLKSILSKLMSPPDWFKLASYSMNDTKPVSVTFRDQKTASCFLMTVSTINKKFCICVLTDAHILRLREKNMEYLIMHDRLTGLPNRICFNKFLETTVVEARENKTKFGILLMDVDNMKILNTTLGKTTGDHLLKTGASVLSDLECNTIHSFHGGSDKYLVIDSDISTKDELKNLCEHIFKIFRNIGINVSAGISFYPEDSTDPETLLKYAVIAVQTAKESGKNSLRFFNPRMYDTFQNRSELQKRLIKATEDQIFDLYYQPQFNIQGNSLRGFEALIRWHDEEFGWVSPEKFIPIAEKTNTILTLGQWVLETAIGTLKQWQTEFNFEGILSVNVSPVQLKSQDFLTGVFTLLEQYDIRKGSLEMEITEGLFIDDMQVTIQKLLQLRSKGILISLDDFGTGYSSFKYLEQLPITTLKIDKTFISNIASKKKIEAEITASIISLTTKMGLETIAEGVENTEQLAELKTLKCTTVQGFLLGKPMTKSCCEPLLTGDLPFLLQSEKQQG